MPLRTYLLYGLFTVLLVGPFIGHVHLFDWDEINFAECSREMFVNGEYNRVTVNYLPFWEKPPLFFWMQAAGYHVFGVGELAARFPNVLCALATVITILLVGRRVKGLGFAKWWVWVYLGSVLPQFYFRSGLLDPWFNLFIFLGLLGVIFHAEDRRNDKPGMWPMFWGGLALGLAVLTKGPTAILLVGLTGGIYWALNRFRFYWCWQGLWLFALTTLAVPALWFGVEYIRHGPWLWNEFIEYQIRLAKTQDAGHGGFPGYHFVVLLFGCFPASFLFILEQARSLKGLSPQKGERGRREGANLATADFWRWMQVLFWVVLVVFSAVQSKIVHYSSMCYLPLTFGAALHLEKLASGDAKLPGWVRFGWVFIGSILGLACLLLPFLGLYKSQVSPVLAADPFAVANLDSLADMHWTGLEPLVGVWSIGVPLLALYLFKKEKRILAFRVLFGGTALTVMFVLWAFMGRIEYLTQGSAIEFLESLKDKKVYVVPIGYRTYTVFFYPQIKAEQAPSLAYQEKMALIPDRWRDSLLTQPIDRPVYAISKINEGDTAKYPLLRKLGAKNGFVFWIKE